MEKRMNKEELLELLHELSIDKIRYEIVKKQLEKEY